MQTLEPSETSSDASRPWFRGWTVLLGSALGVAMPLAYPYLALFPLYIGYAACRPRAWPRYQLFLAYLIGGLGFGAGIRLGVHYGMRDRVLLMLAAPLLAWLGLRALFLYVEARYALIKPVRPARAKSAGRVPAGAVGTSAWSGDAQGETPDGCVRYRFFCRGEIAMGGPTYGDVVFSNGVALRNVGPSIALSDEGSFAALTLPSRRAWGVWLLQIPERRVVDLTSRCEVWEIDRIAGGKLYGRDAPLASNAERSYEIAALLAGAETVDLVEEDGFYFHPAQHTEPLPRDVPRSFSSSGGAHRAELSPHTTHPVENPFSRLSAPDYTLFVDGVKLRREASETGADSAVWVDGAVEGRFLIVGHTVFDFAPGPKLQFDVERHASFALASFDVCTDVQFEAGASDGVDACTLEAFSLPHYFGDGAAEREVSGYWYPSDEEEIAFWDTAGLCHREVRQNLRRRYRYRIDLAALSRLGALYACTTVVLPNGPRPAHTVQLQFVQRDEAAGYSAYRCVTSCGVDPGQAMHEARWSACGRYLAVVLYAAPPAIPTRLRVIDFDTASSFDVPGHYGMPRIQWFDAGKLDLTHVVGMRESLTLGPEQSEVRELRLGEANGSPYELLVAGLAERQRPMRAPEAQSAAVGGSARGRAQLLVQHCTLFAPDFAQPVLQPPRKPTNGG